MNMGELVRSEWMIDPDNPAMMMRREPDSRDSEYWDQVSKGDNVMSTARMFERGSPCADGQGFPIFMPGKIDTQSFIQMFDSNTSGSEHLKPGKLNISDVWDPNQNYPSEGGQPIQIEGQIKPVGKLNIKDLFQNQEENNNIQKPKAQIGKLDPQQIFDTSSQQDQNLDKQDRQQVIKVGKLNTNNLFKSNQQEDQQVDKIIGVERRIGKLDFTNLFPQEQPFEDQETKQETTQPDLCNRKVGKLNIQETFNCEARDTDHRLESSVKVGKLNNPEAIFSQQQSSPTRQREEIRVGKLRLPEDFSNSEKNSPTDEVSRPRVGKLSINPFEVNHTEQESQTRNIVQVGKLKQDIFQTKSEETSTSEGFKFYKPTIQPKKMKIDQVFPVNDSNNNTDSQREEVKVGKLVTDQFLPKTEERPQIRNHTPGKINTSKLFAKDDDSPAVESHSPIQIGRVKSSVFESKLETEPEKPKLRGARKLNKANRISCLIDNLTTDQPSSTDTDETERDEDDLEVEEHFNLGKDRLCQLQSMFDKSPASSTATQQISPGARLRGANSVGAEDDQEISELKSGGLVSSNLQKFSSGNIISSSSSNHVPSKLQETTHFVGTVQQKFCKSKQSPEPSETRPARQVGKITNPDSFLVNSSETESHKQKEEIRVGKLNTKELFKSDEADTVDADNTPVKRIGKINTENIFQKSECESEEKRGKVHVGKLKIKSPTNCSSPRGSRSSREVGRLSSEWILNSPEEEDSPSPNLSQRVGKLSGDKLKIGQDEKTPDTESHVQRVGKLTQDKLKIGQEEMDQSSHSEPRVGKLSENRLKIGQDDTETNDDAESTANTGRVGKLTGERFKIGGEDGDENTDDCSDDMVTRVGKLSVDRYKLGQEEKEDLNNNTSSPKVRKLDETRYKLNSEVDESEKSDDTNIVPIGTVSKSASAFLNPSPSFQDSEKQSKTRKSRSGNLDSTAIEMQKKYEEQLAASKKAKEKKSQSFRIQTKDDSALTSRKTAITKSNKSLKRAETFVASNTKWSEQTTRSSEETTTAMETSSEEVKGNVKEAKAKFFQSLEESSSSMSTKGEKASRIGTSILPVGGQSKGKSLFNKCAEQIETVAPSAAKDIPGLDFEEIEDEFDRLHKEMMGDE